MNRRPEELREVEAALRRALPPAMCMSPGAERQEFLANFLKAVHDETEPPLPPTGGGAQVLCEESLEPTAALLTTALNAAVAASSPPDPLLAGVAGWLLEDARKNAEADVAAQQHFFTRESLLESVASGEIAPLRGRWVIALHQRGGRLQRRQDLPAEAFWTAEELRTVAEKLGDSWGLLFVALSYRWLSAEHPDPDGFHLATVARAASLYVGPWNGGFGWTTPLGEAFHKAGLQGNCKKEEAEALTADFALLWDFASLHQKPRTDAQTELFQAGLGRLPVWYGHSESVVWMQTELPAGFEEQMAALNEPRLKEGLAPLARTYGESGWCFVESMISAGVKSSSRRLDLAKRTDGVNIYSAGEASHLDDRRLDRMCAAKRPPPVPCDAIRHALAHEKKFTNGADVDVVDGIYRAFFNRVRSTATELDFKASSWADEEVSALGRVLPSFSALTSLRLERNSIGDQGVGTLLEALAASPSISSINMLCNRFSSASSTQLLAFKASRPNLVSLCGLAPDAQSARYSDLELGAPGVYLLAPELGALQRLNNLELYHCGIDDEAAAALAPVIGACTTLTYLNLGCNSIGVAGMQALGTGFATSSSLHNISLFSQNPWGSLGDEAAKVLAPGVASCTSLRYLTIHGNGISEQAAGLLGEAASVPGGRSYIMYPGRGGEGDLVLHN